MVCDKCQLKTSKVITPDVIKKPTFKSNEETKEQPRPKLASSVIDFSEVTT